MRNSLHELNMLTHKLEEFNDFEKAYAKNLRKSRRLAAATFV